MRFLIISLLCIKLATSLPVIGNVGPLEEEMSGFFEGDIDLTDDQVAAIQKRTGLIAATKRWPNNIVPYQLNDQTDAQKIYIRQALDEMESVLCLKFVVRTTETDYVNVESSATGCSSKVGRSGGAQRLHLAPNTPGSGCFRWGTIMHEFIHAIGFYHMQSATERDDYVTIMWDNIEAGKEGNFNTYDATKISQFSVPYDYGSVMHYSATSFSMNGEKTIVAKDPVAGAAMGQRLGLSDYDIQRINNMYCPQ